MKGSTPEDAPGSDRLVQRVAAYRRLSAAILQDLESTFLEPYRSPEKRHDPFVYANSAFALHEGLFKSYLATALAALDLASALKLQGWNHAVVVPSLRVSFPFPHAVLSDRPPGGAKDRWHVSSLDESLARELAPCLWNTDGFTVLQGASRTKQDLEVSLSNVVSRAPSVFRERLDSIRDLVFRGEPPLLASSPTSFAHCLTDKDFLPRFPAKYFSTARFFSTRTRNEDLRAIVFHRGNGCDAKDGTIARVSLAGNLEQAVQRTLGRLACVGGDRSKFEQDFGELEPYIRWVRRALDIEAIPTAGTETEVCVEGALPNQHGFMLAVSCFDPVIGRSDGTLVLYLKSCPSDAFVHSLYEFVVPILTRFSRFDETLADYQRVRSKAMRATVSGILARSMAHDIGSHMLASASLQDLQDRAKAQGSDSAVARDHAAFEYLRDYLRHRMVWLAEATTSEPYWELPQLLWSDILQPFLFVDGQCSPVSRFLAADKGVSQIKMIPTLNGEALDTHRDLSVSIPTGMVGKHALYAIIENVVRNAVRSNEPPTEDKTITVHLCLEDDERFPELVRCRIWDDFSRFEQEKFAGIQRYCAPLPGATERIGGGQRRMSPSPWPLIMADGSYPRDGWGIKEMRIAAAWLRGGTLLERLFDEERGSFQNEPPLLAPVHAPSTMCGPHGYMGYELYLRREARLLIVSEKLRAQLANKRKSLEGRGIVVRNELCESVTREAARFEVLLVDSRDDRDRIARVLADEAAVLPQKLFVACGNGLDLPENALRLEPEDLSALARVISDPRATEEWLLKALSGWWSQRVNEPEAQLSLLITVDGLANRPDERSAWEETCRRLFEAAPTWKFTVLDSTALIEINNFCSVAKNLAHFRHHSPDTAVDENPKLKFREIFGAGTVLHSALVAPPRACEARMRMLAQLGEAAMLRVGVIDERLSTLNRNKRATLFRQGIEVAGKTTHGLTERPTQQVLEQVFTRLRVDKRDSRWTLLIHRGLLEEAFGEQIDGKKVANWCRATLQNGEIQDLVIISDRGADRTRLPSGCRFLPYATVESSIREGQKTVLTQLLLHARGSSGADDSDHPA